MRPSTSLLGASRLPLTPKRGNKDFYKGTGQSYVPGGGHRTGPPGKHVIGGKAKYRLLDERVRYFVGPGSEALRKAGEASSPLKPYVSTLLRPPTPQSLPVTPSFSPNVTPRSLSLNTSDGAEDGDGLRRITTADQKRFSRAYRAKSLEERQALIMQARRAWWDGMSRGYPAGQGDVVESTSGAGAGVEAKAKAKAEEVSN